MELEYREEIGVIQTYSTEASMQVKYLCEVLQMTKHFLVLFLKVTVLFLIPDTVIETIMKAKKEVKM